MAVDSLVAGLVPLTRRTLGAMLNATPASLEDHVQNWSALFEILLAMGSSGGGGGTAISSYGLMYGSGTLSLSSGAGVALWANNGHDRCHNITPNDGAGSLTLTNTGDYLLIVHAKSAHVTDETDYHVITGSPGGSYVGFPIQTVATTIPVPTHMSLVTGNADAWTNWEDPPAAQTTMVDIVRMAAGRCSGWIKKLSELGARTILNSAWCSLATEKQ